MKDLIELLKKVFCSNKHGLEKPLSKKDKLPLPPTEVPKAPPEATVKKKDKIALLEQEVEELKERFDTQASLLSDLAKKLSELQRNQKEAK